MRTRKLLRSTPEGEAGSLRDSSQGAQSLRQRNIPQWDQPPFGVQDASLKALVTESYPCVNRELGVFQRN